jgi:hypothetical protein
MLRVAMLQVFTIVAIVAIVASYRTAELDILKYPLSDRS